MFLLVDGTGIRKSPEVGPVTDAVRALFDEFRHDHAVLGHGLHAVAAALRAGDDGKARRAARDLDRAAGAHIAFEERYFYPELRRLIGDVEVDAFHRQHAEGHAAIRQLAGDQPARRYSASERARLLGQIETMQVHTDECGEHFAALGRIPHNRQEQLLGALRDLREEAPAWTAIAAEGAAQ